MFFIWTGIENKLEGFLQRLNNFQPNLKFTHEKSKTSVNVLYFVAGINGDKFEIDPYSKSSNCHQFLEFNSAYTHQKINCL